MATRVKERQGALWENSFEGGGGGRGKGEKDWGRGGGGTVYHLHVHILGGKQLGWPPC